MAARDSEAAASRSDGVRVVAFVLAVAFTTPAAAPWRTFHANGVNYRYPPRWFATSLPLTAVTSPHQSIAAASFAFPTDVAGADGCEPTEALAALPPDGAFVYGWEYGQVSARLGLRPRLFPPRPIHFTFPKPTHLECFGRTPGYVLRFSDAGWAFQIQIALGSDTSKATRIAVLDVLDSFRVSR